MMLLLGVLFFSIAVNYMKYRKNRIKAIVPWTIYGMLIGLFVLLIFLFFHVTKQWAIAVCFSTVSVFAILFWKKSEGISNQGIQVVFNLTMTIRTLTWNQIEKVTGQYVSDQIVRLEIFSYPLNRSFCVRAKSLQIIQSLCHQNGVKFQMVESI